jgi:glycosyltransferase involved in cell wall biosynthesis
VTSSLRIAHVVCTDAFAGVERYVTTLGIGLAARGCRVVVIGGQPDRMKSALDPAGVDWVGGASLTEAISRLARRRDLDLVHAHMSAAELTAVVSSPIIRRPIVATRHFAQRRGSSGPARLVGRFVTTRLAAQLAISHYVAERVEGKTVVVPPGTPTLIRVATASERQPVVLVTQRLEVEKRTDLALRAWRQSGLAGQGWRLQLAGGGHQRDALEGLARQLDISRSVDFLGMRDDIEALQQRASILLAPRDDEPFGLSVVEAMAAGLPVVAAKGGGHLETVGVTPGAALYAPGDSDEAGRLLADLAADPARRDEYGAALRTVHDERFTVDQQVDATLEVYRSIVR